MAKKLFFAITLIFGEAMDFIESNKINHDCKGTVFATTEVKTEQLNMKGSCDILFKTEESRILHASFDGFDPGYYGYADLIKIYDGDKRGVKQISLDIADGGVINTDILSRGPVLIVSISRNLNRTYEINITTFDQEYVEINTSQYDGIVKSPRHMQRRKGSENNVMMKNLKFSCRFTPELGSSLSLNFSKIDIGDEVIQILTPHHNISLRNSTLKHNVTSEEVSVLLDTFPNRFPRGKGFSMIFNVCGGSSNDSQANISLPTPIFYGFDKSLRCSYVYTCPSGYAPVLTLTVKEGSQENKSSIIEIYTDNDLLTPTAVFSLKNVPGSQIGKGTKIAVLLHYNSSVPLMHPVLFANCSCKEIVLTAKNEEGDEYSFVATIVYSGIGSLLVISLLVALLCFSLGKNRKRNAKTEPAVVVQLPQTVQADGEREPNVHAEESQVYVERDDGVYDCPWERRKVLGEPDINYAEATQLKNNTEYGYGSELPKRQQEIHADETEGHYDFAANKEESQNEDTLMRDKKNYTIVQKMYVQNENTTERGLTERTDN